MSDQISIIINVILIHQHPAGVDPTLRDLDQLQLVSFIQSFGIPVDSMTKLLQTLDQAVTESLKAVNESVFDEVRKYCSEIVRNKILLICISRRTRSSWWRCSTSAVPRAASCSPAPSTSTSTSGTRHGDRPEESLCRVREASVEQFLRIHHRIPDGPHSSLRAQTTVVMRAEEVSGDTIPQEYITTFRPFQTRAALAVSFFHIV